MRRLRERPDGGAGRLRLISLAEFHRSAAENEAISAYCARVLRIDRAAEAPREGAQADPPDDVAAAIRLDLFAAACTASRAVSASIAICGARAAAGWSARWCWAASAWSTAPA